MSEAIENYIKSRSKSQIVGFVLTLLFGPLGLFYSNWVLALVLTVIVFFTAFTLLIPVIVWLFAISMTFYCVAKHNYKLRTEAELKGL